MNKSFDKLISMELSRIFIGQVFLSLLESVNGFIDMIFGGKFLGSDEMGAIGLFNPVIVLLMALSNLIVTGAGVRGSELYGKGDLKNTDRVFSTCMCILGLTGLATVMVLGFGMNAVVSVLSGGCVGNYLQSYVKGILLGCFFILLPNAMAPFLQIMGKGKTVVTSCFCMAGSNMLLNYLFIRSGFGVFGMGFASSISYMIQALVMLSGFFGRKSFIHFTKKLLRPKEYCPLFKYGLSGFLCMFVISIKSACVNRIITNNFESMYVSVLAVINSLLSLFGAFITGASNAAQIVGNVYYGDENETGVRIVIREGLKQILISTAIVIAVIVVFARVIAALFYTPGTAEAEAMIRAMRIIPWYLPFMAIVAIMKVRMIIFGKAVLTAAISVAEQLSVLIFNYLLGFLWGIDGVWLACTFGHGTILLLILIYKLIKHEGMFEFTLPDKREDVKNKTYEVMDINDAVRTSEDAKIFCEDNCLDAKTSLAAALCIEELTRNIIEHGGQNIKYGIMVNLVKSKESLRITIKDDCRPFNPEKWLSLHKDGNVTDNIGIRLVDKISDEMTYRQNIGMNVITINFMKAISKTA